MYPTLYHFCKDLFGIELEFLHYLQSFGVILAVSIIIGFTFFKIELKRKEDLKEIQESKSILLPITFWALVSGLIGGKIFAWFESPESFSFFFSDPFSGLSIYGGLLFGFVTIYWYLSRIKTSILPVLDAAAPSLILSYGIGRLACHISGDGDWGIVATSKPSWLNFLPDWFWSYSYPNNILQEGVLMENCLYNDYCYQLANPVFPTPIYETLACLLIFSYLWIKRKKITQVGKLFFIYLIFSSTERFLIEFIRINDSYSLLGFHLSQAQIIAFAALLIGILGLWKINRKSETLG